MDKEDSQALEALERKMKPRLTRMLSTSALFPTVGRENKDKAACRMEGAYNKDKDKDTEDIHRIRKNQGEQQKELKQ
jgi:hypothetical protein